jgi:hypothetical protein
MLEISTIEFTEDCLAIFLAIGCRCGWSPGRLLGMPQPCSALLGY